MKKQSTKLLVITLACMLCLTNSFAQTTIKEITDKFFQLYAKDPSAALDYGFSTNKWVDTKQEDIVNLKKNLKSLVDLCGEYYSYELISEKNAGQHIKLMTYIVHYDREPVRLSFLFYQPKDSWRLYNFSYSENIDADLQPAVK
jgi:hypothetical protein